MLSQSMREDDWLQLTLVKSTLSVSVSRNLNVLDFGHNIFDVVPLIETISWEHTRRDVVALTLLMTVSE